ncbi:MAG: hypothetical protein HZB44_07485 [Actinobacteria bacterium]|nr:hypothetical protein [Actinomycetota bacterium]
MNLPWEKTLAVLSAAGILAAGTVTGCGGTDGVTVTETRTATIAQTTTSAPARNAGSNGSGNTVAGGPVMPNVDESQVEAVAMAATAAFDREWGDGSGVNVVWGPNINSGWALIGLENNSGAAAKDALLFQENGAWTVKGIGNALAADWRDRTPPELWPTS